MGKGNGRDAQQHTQKGGHNAHQRIVTRAGTRMATERLTQRIAVPSAANRNSQKRHRDEHDNKLRVFLQRLPPCGKRRMRTDEQNDARKQQQRADCPRRPLRRNEAQGNHRHHQTQVQGVDQRGFQKHVRDKTYTETKGDCASRDKKEALRAGHIAPLPNDKAPQRAEEMQGKGALSPAFKKPGRTSSSDHLSLE